jgi:hypothetical protein
MPHIPHAFKITMEILAAFLFLLVISSGLGNWIEYSRGLQFPPKKD